MVPDRHAEEFRSRPGSGRYRACSTPGTPDAYDIVGPTPHICGARDPALRHTNREIAKNYFLGLPAYFMAWIVFITLAAGIWRRLTIPRSTRSVIAAGTTLEALLVFVLAISHAQKNIPADYDYNLRTV
jgi:hypothetical protein